MRKIQKKLSKPIVTVAVCAYNEGKNIKNFLESVLDQKEEGYVLEHIWVFSDGSTDKTVEIANSLKSPKIKVFEGKTRVGKSTRLNQIYKGLKSDILVQSDADVIFAHPYVIGNIIEPIIKDNEVGMCGGNIQPLKGRTFTEESEIVSFQVYQSLLRKLGGGNNVFSANGGILAYKRELVKKIQVPTDMIANDVYTYFCCKTLGFKYRCVENAKVYFRCPATLKDKLKQNMRGAAIEIRMLRYFDPEIVKIEYYIPASTRIKSIILQLLKDPIKCAYIFVINTYCHLRSEEFEQKLTAKWPIAWSTKRL